MLILPGTLYFSSDQSIHSWKHLNETILSEINIILSHGDNLDAAQTQKLIVEFWYLENNLIQWSSYNGAMQGILFLVRAILRSLTVSLEGIEWLLTNPLGQAFPPTSTVEIRKVFSLIIVPFFHGSMNTIIDSWISSPSAEVFPRNTNDDQSRRLKVKFWFPLLGIYASVIFRTAYLIKLSDIENERSPIVCWWIRDMDTLFILVLVQNLSHISTEIFTHWLFALRKNEWSLPIRRLTTLTILSIAVLIWDLDWWTHYDYQRLDILAKLISLLQRTTFFTSNTKKGGNIPLQKELESALFTDFPLVIWVQGA